MKRKVLTILLTASLALVATGVPAATPAPAGKQAQRQARVRGGETVPLANSKLSAGQLSVMRPGYRSLRPKLRGNAE